MQVFLKFTENSFFFGICLTLAFYELGVWIRNKTKKDYMNPLLLAMIGICTTLACFSIPVEHYQKGASFISLFLGPATVSLGLIIYQQRKILKEYFWVVLVSTSVGALTCILSVALLCKLFSLEKIYFHALFAKSITTPLAIGVSETLQGIPSLTVLAVVVTGVIGSVFAPWWIKLCGIEDAAVAGLAIGTSSHALGTAKALELGEVQGAMSSVAICTTGLVTVLLSLVYLVFSF